MKRRSISVPIILASVAVALSIALLVGWTVFALRTGNTTIMVLGVLSFGGHFYAIDDPWQSDFAHFAHERFGVER